eukprot:TRINITY_DN38305_c0_g1_i1.p1 TRINITY_DN38305_c0_g1~~TRINITY_DN38305_c0_g1_i1.p1  ORF type:complete len:239 (+),score=15.15 TRINITY_DN38305_c0_g1_i1:86-802(+)
MLGGDLLAVGCTTGCVLMVAIGIWCGVQGGSIPLSVPFGWHPVLMCAGFSCWMPLGRWIYVTDALGGDKLADAAADKERRRPFHRALMTGAAAAVIGGYVAIFYAHLPKQVFFGYDFKQGQWNEDLSRLLHVYLGYLLVVLVLAQACMGLLKAYTLQHRGVRRFAFHGSLGKLIIQLGAFNILVATWFWKWSLAFKLAFGLLVTGTALYCTGTSPFAVARELNAASTLSTVPVGKPLE